MYVDLSTSQYIPFGKMLCNLYYNNQMLLSQAPGRSGYPHNGGEHTLLLSGDKGDIIAFLDLLMEKYQNVVNEILLIKTAVQAWRKGDPALNAKDLFSQRIYDYHEAYSYKVIEGVVHFYQRPGYPYAEFALQAIHHLELVAGWGDAGEEVEHGGIVHIDDFMTVEIFRRDTTETYRARVHKEQCAIAQLYGDDV